MWMGIPDFGRRHKFVWAMLAALAVLIAQPRAGQAAGQPPDAIGDACSPRRFKIALDVGHTQSQPGATSARGTPEFHYNQRLAQTVHTALARAGISAVLIGAAGSPMQLLERTRLAQVAGADLFLSLHHDSVQPRYLSTWMVDGQARAYSDVFRGYSVFVSNENVRASDSLRFAALLGTALRGAGFTPSLHHAEPIPGEGRPIVDAHLGIFRFDKLAVLRTAVMPAVLLEAGVIVHRGEEEQVRSPAFLDRLVMAVAGSVQRYCSVTGIQDRPGPPLRGMRPDGAAQPSQAVQ